MSSSSLPTIPSSSCWRASSVLLAGVDPARNPGADNTAIAFGVLDRGRLEVVETVENLTTLEAVAARWRLRISAALPSTRR